MYMWFLAACIAWCTVALASSSPPVSPAAVRGRSGPSGGAAALPPHVPSITTRRNGVFIDGAPYCPVGYCNHAHAQGGGDRSFDTEAAEGFTSIFIYRGLPGQADGRWGNETWADTMAFMDRAAAVGMRVLFDCAYPGAPAYSMHCTVKCLPACRVACMTRDCTTLRMRTLTVSQNAMLPPMCGIDRCKDPPAPPYDVIRDAVRRVKDHPALLSWYLIDEPDGGGYPPEFVHAAAAIIREMDTKHPITACFDTTNRPDGTWSKYADAVDVLLADIYPISGE
jgi:hypothetical protein